MPVYGGPEDTIDPSDGAWSLRSRDVGGACQDIPLSSAIILAGGASRRMGTDKALLTLDGKTLLARVVAVMARVAGEILVVGAPPRHVPEGVRYMPDDLPGSGPLGGILTGLRRARQQYAVVAACDMPFLQPALLRFLLGSAPGYEAVIPRFQGRAHPTLGVYSRETIEVIERRLAQGERSIVGMLESIHVRWLDEASILRIDPSGKSFRNVNTPSEWEAILREARSSESR